MHEEKHFKQPAFVRDLIIGLSDGITVPFALTAGISGAIDNNLIIVTAGIAEICAGSISMGLGGFLSAKTEEEHYYNEQKREYLEVENIPDRERQEVKDVFAGYGLSESTQELVADEICKDKHVWVDFMMRYELGLEKPDSGRAHRSAFNIALSYIVGGLIPLSGYIFTSSSVKGLLASSCITIVCLLFFGYLKSKVTGQNPITGSLKTTGIGIAAAVSAFAFAYFFSHKIV
ncbi:MAG: iron transporter [Bacteroidia bacterium]|nr:iron transporter [Bacteroidia bacterium]